MGGSEEQTEYEGFESAIHRRGPLYVHPGFVVKATHGGVPLVDAIGGYRSLRRRRNCFVKSPGWEVLDFAMGCQSHGDCADVSDCR